VICEKIFRPWFSPTLLGAKAGLPLQVELQRAVQERMRAVREQLQDLLVELIREDTVNQGEGQEHKMRRVHTALNF
ncbi:hypothetical protein M9458_048246, partial [Cirrhinus mrigala]